MQINKYESSSYILNLKRKVRISENTFSLACHNAATSRLLCLFLFAITFLCKYSQSLHKQHMSNTPNQPANVSL